MQTPHKLKILIILLGIVISQRPAQAQINKLNPFISVGSNGIGIGVNYKKNNLYARYLYYYEQPSTNMYFYYHLPSVMLTRTIYDEEIGNVYAGIGFSNVTYKQKYFIQGINTTNYFIAIPIGIQLTPFKKSDKFSIVLESGVEIEHTLPLSIHPLIKGYDWQLGLARGIIEIRYKLGKNSKR